VSLSPVLTRPIRLGAVQYLNTRPLIWGLQQGRDPRFELLFDLPSRCAEMLRTGACDLAMIPSIEFARGSGWDPVPGVCIASDGPARSVMLFSRVEPERLTSVALDPASRTSVALLTILLRERWHAEPALSEDGGPLEEVLGRHDAALVIGDRALFAAPPSGTIVVDLGAEWAALTGLPFVFAFWAGRTRSTVAPAAPILQRSARAGARHLDDIAASWTWEGRPRPDIALPYLRDAMRYRWDQRARDGLLRFYLLAARHRLIDEVPDPAAALEPALDEVAG